MCKILATIASGHIYVYVLNICIYRCVCICDVYFATPTRVFGEEAMILYVQKLSNVVDCGDSCAISERKCRVL